MAKGKSEEGGKHIVVSPFRDKSNWDLSYEEGQDVSDLGEDRLKELEGLGLVEKK